VKKNRQAIKLRDEGHRKEARQILLQNAEELEKYAKQYDSLFLRIYAKSNREDAENLSPNRWRRQKKSMMTEADGAEDTQYGGDDDEADEESY
jgi:Ca-activated chloride channel family protein